MLTRKKRARAELDHLSKVLGGEVVHENGIYTLKMDKSLGAGNVQCVCFDEGLVAIEFNMLLKESRKLYLDNNGEETLYFLYCLEGNCFHNFNGDELVTKLEELQTAVVRNDKKSTSQLLIRKNNKLILNLIKIDKVKYAKKLNGDCESIDTDILELLNTSSQLNHFFHLGKINLEIGELIKMLHNAKYVDNLSALMQFRGICHLILAKQFAQFKFDMEYGQTPSTTLLNRELKLISSVSATIKKAPEVQYSISQLCRDSGLSASKLQQGFRFVYDMTVGEFIRTTRLEEAEKLLRTTEMNVSEVVYSIGFTSRSYFCRIFKAKYHCSPKQYKQNLKGKLADILS